MRGQGAGFVAALRRELRSHRRDYLEGDDWFDQQRSPLLSHCSTVRARIEAGLPGARIEGDRYLLSTAALAEELSSGTT